MKHLYVSSAFYQFCLIVLLIEDCIEFDTQFIGQPINGDASHQEFGGGCGMRESPKECQRLCYKIRQCDVFTYDVAQKHCWYFKSDGIERVSSAGMISGTKGCSFQDGPNNEQIGHGIVLA